MIPVFATYVANGIKLAELEKRSEYPLLLKKRNSLVFEYAADQRFFVYSFGAFVFSGIDAKTANKIVRKFVKALENPIEKEFIEEYGYEVAEIEKDSVEFDSARLKSINPDKLSLLAEVLAQSVAIDYFDYLTDEIVSKFDQVNSGLEKRGRLLISTRSLGKTIGAANTILQSSITRMALLDKPELVWEEAELESFYASLRKMFELDDRFRIIEFKVDYIRNTSEIALSMLSDRRMLLLETIIVLLFVVDLILFAFELLIKK
jgi:uncharacterized Rmd1/YagE family protein